MITSIAVLMFPGASEGALNWLRSIGT